MTAPEPPVFSLDPAKVGAIVVRLGAASAMAHHSTIRATLRDYVDERSPELAFVRDLFVCSTREVADRWYGGEFEAACLAVHTLGTRYGARLDG